MDLEALLSCFEPEERAERAFVEERWKQLSRLPDYSQWTSVEARVWIPAYMEDVAQLESEIRRPDHQLFDGYTPGLENRRVEGRWRGPTKTHAHWLVQQPSRPDEELIGREAADRSREDAADDMHGAWLRQVKNAIPEAFEQLVQDGELNTRGETAFRALLNLSQDAAADVEETLAAVVKGDGEASMNKLCKLINEYVLDNGWSKTNVISNKTLKKWARVIYSKAKEDIESFLLGDAECPDLVEGGQQTTPKHQQDEEIDNVEAY